MKRRVLLLGLLVVLVFAMTAGSAGAVTDISFLGSGYDQWGFWYNFTITGSTDDGGGLDSFAAICYNGNGEVMDLWQGWVTVGYQYVAMWRCYDWLADTVSPITVDMRDTDGFIAWDVNAFLAYPSVGNYTSTGSQAVQIPPGYIQHNILCDTPIYDSPGGTPVGDNAITAGQTWHLNPTTEPGLDGQNWTAIFVGGTQVGYIPTSCVGTPTEFGLAEMYE
jgi:hypothetical protein